jgi:hypothetical protein
VFSAFGDGTLVRVRVMGQGINFWFLEFSAPRGTRLRVGAYEDAMRSAFRDATRPGLDVGGQSRGCNTVAGRFEVQEVEFRPDGLVPRFRATFEQHCDNRSAALRGEVRFTAP